MPEKIKINKCTKLICNVTDKKNYSIHLVALKQALNHGLKLIRVHSVISFRPETTEYKRNKLASEPNYHSTKYISKHLLIMEMKKTEVKINKAKYLGQAVLDISKTLMFEFWYDYLKPMYGDKIRLCYTDTDSFIMHIKTDDFYKHISADVGKWFDNSNYDKNDN